MKQNNRYQTKKGECSKLCVSRSRRARRDFLLLSYFKIMQQVIKLLGTGVFVYFVLSWTLHTTHLIGSCLTLFYGIFFTALDQSERLLLRVLFVVILLSIAYALFWLTRSNRVLNALLIILLLLSVPIFSLNGL